MKTNRISTVGHSGREPLEPQDQTNYKKTKHFLTALSHAILHIQASTIRTHAVELVDSE
jgi:hypothetical protein